MSQTLSSVTLLLSMTISCQAQVASSSTAFKPQSSLSPAPLYRISFQRGEPVAGVVASRAIAAPYQCTNDGTIFINMVLQASADTVPVEQLVSIPPSGDAHEFRLDQLTDLYDIMRKGYYASESNVAFLVIAASEDKQGNETFVTSDGTKHEVTRNLADRHDYIVLFDREGNFKKKLQMDDTFAVQRLGAFPSGTFLALGFDKQDHTPRLALLQDDAKFLRFLELPKGNAPKAMFRMKDTPGKGVVVSIAPSQLVPHGDSIIVVQNNSKYPLLEVNEAGAIRKIEPKLPEGERVNLLIPSNKGLYAQMQTSDTSDESIYELNPQDGSLIRRIQVGKSDTGVGVACVHDGKFLSFEKKDGKLTPLIGTAEPAVSAEKQSKSIPPVN